MKRSAIWLWCAAGFSGVVLLALIGLWVGVCWWPDVIGPRLPPWLAFRIAGMSDAGFSAGSQRFGQWSEYWMDHEQTPDDIAACNATLCRALRGSRDEQMLALRLINSGDLGFVGATPERNAMVFALTTSPDNELRKLALSCWKGDGISASTQIRTITPEASANDHSPLSPDRWIPGKAAGIAWRMLVFTNDGDSHLTPNRYQNYLQENLDRLLTYDDGRGRFSHDARDNAVVIAALASLCWSVDDAALKLILQRAVDRLAQDRSRLEQLWQNDTTTALMTAMCVHYLRCANMPVDDLVLAQRASFDTWWAGRTDGVPPPWHVQGKVVPASIAERWAAETMGAFWCHYASDLVLPPPPLRLADPTECSPLGRYLTMNAAVIYVDPRWKAPFKRRQQELLDTQIITPDHSGAEGCWPAHGEVSREWQTVFTILELNNSWPYNPRDP